MKLLEFAPLLLLCTAIGCTTTRSQALEYVDSGVDSVDRLTQSQYDAALALGADPNILKPREESFRELVSQQDARFAKLSKEIEDQRRLVGETLTAVSSALSVGSSPAAIAAGLLSRFANAESKVSELHNETERIKTEHKTTQADQDELESKVDEVASETEATRQELNDIDLERLRSDIVSKLDGDVAQLQARVAAISDSTLQKLANLDETTEQRLRTVVEEVGEVEQDAAAQRTEILTALKEASGLTAAEIKELEGFSLEELMIILGSAVGAGGLLSRTGSSRSKTEIESIKTELAKKADR